jgi:hypothetical protein
MEPSLFRKIVANTLQKYHPNPVFFDRNLILCSSHAVQLVGAIFGYDRNTQKIKKMMNHWIISEYIRKWVKLMSDQFLIQGRINDSPLDFQMAIDFGNLSARADLAYLYIKKEANYNDKKRAYQLVKEGNELGCFDCMGMMAYFYVFGFAGIIIPENRKGYNLAIESADAGCNFGKIALANFLYFQSQNNDEFDDEIWISIDDKYICRYFERKSSDYDSDDDCYIHRFEQKNIAFSIYNEITEEYNRNPQMSKGGICLPPFYPPLGMSKFSIIRS